MAEKFLQSKLYEYRANSNLVLEADRESRRREDAKGEVESLKSKVHLIKMGERSAVRERPDKDLAGPEPSNKRRKVQDLPGGSSTVKDRADVYKPKSIESRRAYEELLTTLKPFVGDVSNEMLQDAAFEILEILTDPNSTSFNQRKEVQKLVGNLAEDHFRQLVLTSSRITDFRRKIVDEPVDSSDAPEGMAVVFDDEEDVDELEDDNEEEEQEDDLVPAAPSTKETTEAVEHRLEKTPFSSLSAHEIDAYWLQRQLSKFYDDANICAKLSDDVLEALAVTDERQCENSLVTLLDFDKFGLIKELLRHRAKIFYCIKLKQAQSDSERHSWEETMKNDRDGGGLSVWKELHEQNMDEWKNNRIVEASQINSSSANGKNIDQMEISGSEEVYEKKVDLEDLIFREGGHFMSSTRCELPEKSWRAQKKGYEEVHVPAMKPFVSEDEKLVEISSLPSWMQPVFEGVRHLNRVQSKMCSAALSKNDNLLLCAPTGSGKTNVALLCMLGVINKFRTSEGRILSKDFKIVYIAPMKALVQECVQNFGKRLSALGLVVRELSGDQSLTGREISETNVIVTTPEKWDVVTRKSMDRTFTQTVKLLIVDEIHLLHDDRGPVLEAIIARTLRHAELDGDDVRIVGLSATLPNYEDVAAFLRVDPTNGLFYFDASYRPVPLQQQFIGVTEKKILKKIQIMNEICYEKVLLHAGKNQILIFTHSRADTVKTAKALRDLAANDDNLSKFIKEDSASSEILKTEAANVKNSDLRELLPFGFAVHHAGLQRSDRSLVEDLFADKHVQVLVSTATLAWGVNLPCHTVIIKGTQIYSPEKGCWTELSPLDTLQMIGRAGRYGLDSEGEGIIITNHSELQYYLSLVNNQLPIESQLLKRIPDLINAEVVASSISSLDEAAEWLGYSYLFVRMLQNPSLYGVDPSTFATDKNLFGWRRQIALAALQILEKNDLIKFDRRSGIIQSTYLGRISSHYYITNDTMSIFKKNLRPSMSQIDILRLFSLASEFKNIYVKEEEKTELSKLIARVPIPIKESHEEPISKVNVLLQAFISRMKLEGYAITADMIFIQQSAGRLMRAMFEICLAKRWSSVALKILELCVMIERKMWGSQNALRQFHTVPDVIIRKMERVADISWDKYLDLKPQDLGEIVKNPKMGKTLFKFIHMIPRLSVAVNAVPLTRSYLKLDVTLQPEFEFSVDVHGPQLLFWFLVEDCDGDNLLYYEPVVYKGETELSCQCIVKLIDPPPPQYFVKVVADRWLHSVSEVPISFKHLLLPDKFYPTSENLDLRPIPVSALSESQRAFAATDALLNATQTQLFFHVHDSDESVLLFASANSGKTFCAELALERFLRNSNSDECCVVLSPSKMRSAWLYKKWSAIVSHFFDASVCLLTGDSVVDLSLCKQNKVIIADPRSWESLSRKWRTRKVVQQVGLYLLFDLHTIAARGSDYEIAVSRARFIESQLGKNTRFIGLGRTAANATDFGDWLGISKSLVFNFARHSAETKADFHVIALNNVDPLSRVSSLSKYLFRSIRKDPIGSVVYVPSRKQAQMLAVDLLCLMKRAGFSFDVPAELVSSLGVSSSVADLLSHGIFIMHNSMSERDREAISTAVERGQLFVVIATFELAASDLRAPYVFVTDTVVFDGKTKRFVDVEQEDLLTMTSGAMKTCTVFCHSSKKEQVERLIFEPCPVESALASNLHNHFVSEIVNKTIENKAEAVDYLTWTFYYRRLPKNPNFYQLSGGTVRHISDHLSELVESVVMDLEKSKIVMVENEMDLSPLNLAMIASHYNLDHSTVELFATTLTQKTRIKGIIEVLVNAKEFDIIAVRIAEEDLILQLLDQMKLSELSNDYDVQQQKMMAILYSHFNRFPLNSEFSSDLRVVLKIAHTLVQGVVDVLSSQGWLKPTLAAMELSQMLIQGMWDKDSPLLQVPHLPTDSIRAFGDLDPPVETVFDLIDLDDGLRSKILDLPSRQLSEIALFCNAYPIIDVSFAADFEEKVESGSQQTLVVDVVRDISGFEDNFDSIGRVISNRYPFDKFENWWVLIGDNATNTLLSIKRFTMLDKSKVKLDFNAPEFSGKHSLSLFLMCDSYLGVDQEYNFEINV